MEYILMVLAVAGITASDQVSKFLTVEHIPLYGRVEAVPGLFHWTYVQNTGAAFSLLQGAQWLFALIFGVFTLAVIWDMAKKYMPFTRLERWLVVCIYAGGLGNMIDRLRLGYVVDMIAVDFINFPVFNVADCFITCGCILLMVHLALFNKDFWKDEKKK